MPGQRGVRHSQGSWGGRKLYPREISRRKREREERGEHAGNKTGEEKEWREWCAGGSAGIVMIFGLEGI